MFDSLLGGKFSNKSKYAIKCIKERVVQIMKKKRATLKFLRKDIADLLDHGHDTNAFGRIDALIVEINHASCYDMIEQYCGCILEQLPNLQKQRECTQEAMEAMSTLIFAAARFPHLPELCDLRHVFRERYGSHVESSVNAEFDEKSQKETFSMEKKLHLMQEIAKEYSINWDSKKFGTKISSPAFMSDKPKKSSSRTKGDDELSHKQPNGRHRTTVDVPHEEMPPKERHQPTPRNTMQKLQIEPIDIHVSSSVSNGPVRDSYKRTKKFADEPENVKPCYDDTTLSLSVKSKDRQNGTHKDDVNEGFAYDKSSRAQEVRNHKGLEKQTNGSIQSVNVKAAYRVPPYTRSMGRSTNGTQAEEQQHDHGLAHHRFSRAEEGLDPIGVERRPVRPINGNNDGASKLIPPYVKPKVSSVADPIDLIKQVNTSNQDPAGAGYGMSNGHKDNLRDDLLGDDGKPKPRSVRSKYTEVPVNDDVDAIDGGKLLNGTPGSRRTDGRRQITGNHDDGYTELKIIGHRSRARASVEVDNAIDYGKLLIRSPNGQRGQQGSRWNAAAYDGDCEDEKFMDRLLIHYSKKGLPCRPSKARTRTPPSDQVITGVEVSEHQRNSKHKPHPAETVYRRAISRPPERISSAEIVKGPAHAASMQPDC